MVLLYELMPAETRPTEARINEFIQIEQLPTRTTQVNYEEEDIYQSSFVFLDVYRQGIEWLWLLTAWYYNLPYDQLPIILLNNMENLVFAVNDEHVLSQSQEFHYESDQTHTTFSPDVHQSAFSLDGPPNIYSKAAEENKTERLINCYPFAKFSKEYNKWIFINPQPNETSQHKCSLCSGPIIIGYRCQKCIYTSPFHANLICTMCSIAERHEQSFGQDHRVRLTFSKHCEEWSIDLNGKVINLSLYGR